MRNPTKRSLTRKLDKACSEIVRARGKCAKCGKGEYEHLDPAHIFSRKFRNTRWDVDLNIICLCDGCHFWAHSCPTLFTEWVKEVYLGKIKYENLKKAHNEIKKWALEEMQELLKQLTTP